MGLEQKELTPEQHQQASQIQWQQSLKFGDFVTPGGSSLPSQLGKAKYLPENMAGLSVLDMGAAEGYFSFLCEARGASRVVAIDQPKRWRKEYGQQGFNLAAQVYGSNVIYKELDAIDIDQLDEKFDIILFLGLYYHLNDPILALKRITDCLKPGGRVFLEGPIMPRRKPVLQFFGTTYNVASVPFFELMCEHFGYSRMEILTGTWQFGYRYKLFTDNGYNVVTSLASTAVVSTAWHMNIFMRQFHRVYLVLEKQA